MNPVRAKVAKHLGLAADHLKYAIAKAASLHPIVVIQTIELPQWQTTRNAPSYFLVKDCPLLVVSFLGLFQPQVQLRLVSV